MRLTHSLQVIVLFLATVRLLLKDVKLALTSTPLSLFSPMAVVLNVTNRNVATASNLDALNNQPYVWYGNHWMPPPGVPLYTREDMKKAFPHFDTLWIGDSTARRAFATTFALINSTNTSISVDDLDSERILDVNKYNRKGYHEDTCRMQRHNAKLYLRKGIPEIWGARSICRRVGSHSFDFIRVDCLKDLLPIAELHWEMKRYSLIVIGIGIHDFLRISCGSLPRGNKSVDKENPFQMLEKNAITTLQAAQQMAAMMQQTNGNETSTTAVLWRTAGFNANTTQFSIDGILHLNQVSNNFIQRNKDSTNGTLRVIDWGSAVWPRSFFPEKVESDISAHYGLEARLLMAQMTTQQLMHILKHSKVPSS